MITKEVVFAGLIVLILLCGMLSMLIINRRSKQKAAEEARQRAFLQTEQRRKEAKIENGFQAIFEKGSARTVTAKRVAIRMLNEQERKHRIDLETIFLLPIYDFSCDIEEWSEKVESSEKVEGSADITIASDQKRAEVQLHAFIDCAIKENTAAVFKEAYNNLSKLCKIYPVLEQRHKEKLADFVIQATVRIGQSQDQVGYLESIRRAKNLLKNCPPSVQLKYASQLAGELKRAESGSGSFPRRVAQAS